MKNTFYFATLFFLLCFCFFTKAHTHAPSSNSSDRIALIKKIYEQAISLSPEVLSSAEKEPRYSEAYIKMGGQYIALDNGFYDLVKGWIRLYRHELERYCPCDINEHELVQSAKDIVAKGFFASKVVGPVTHFVQHTSESATLLGTKYGKVAGALKASAEVAEHSLSVFLGGKGISVFCDVIDVMILFFFRKAQIYARVLGNAKNLNQNRLWMSFRLAYLNRLIKNAQKKVFFYIQTPEIHSFNNTSKLPVTELTEEKHTTSHHHKHHTLAQINQEGTGKKSQRAKWLNKINQKAEPLLMQIQALDTQLEQDFISQKERKKLFKERQKLYKKIENITAVSKKGFFGKRYKRLLFLRSRKGHPDYLKGVTFPDKTAETDWFWPLSIQENILERALKQGDHNSEALDRKSVLPTDEIRTGLAQEFAQKIKESTPESTKEHVQHIERVLMDIDNIFNPSLSFKERYLLAHIVEFGLTGFFKHYLNMINNRLTSSTKDMGFFGKIRLQGKLRGKFEYYVLVYSDFLKTIALTNKTTIAFYKHSAMDSLLLFFEYLHHLDGIARQSYTKKELWAKLDQNLRRIQAFQIQREKRTAYSWIPFRSPLPYCRNLLGAL